MIAVVQSPQADPARAAHPGHEAFGVAQQTGSAHIRRELGTLDAELLERWPAGSEALVSV
ncbi:hypothetical protein [Nonomuraea africana]|uniref:Uncharacterized protein n=1 Tax=Nonomuraea africana TaxID=46171 RepID=A0ABR9KBH7_9ACTN|nr:hypothetical protein [Nonomuraea africana]MBE1559371.1 hypothetical protein [Nonomuraea africana]